MDQAAIARAAALLFDNRRAPAALAPLPADCRPGDEAAAYDLQDAVNRRLAAAGLGAVTGWKIGCTTPTMQRFLNIGNPCAGAVFATTVHRDAGVFRRGDHHHAGVECEIAVRLDADLPPDGAPYDRDRVAFAVGAAMAAIEVVDDRYRDFRRFDTPTLIADNFFNAGLVLGPPVEAWRALDLAALAGAMQINGQTVGSGFGRDILGHPLEGLAWLANLQARRGTGLVAGQVVTLGSVVQTQWVAAGDVAEVTVEGLGGARASFV